MTRDFCLFASVVRCYAENDVSIIGLGDHDEVPRNYAIISRFDEDDMPEATNFIGLQTSLSEQEYAAAISIVALNRDSIEFTIIDHKIEDVSTGKIKVNFDPLNTDIATLLEYLHSIFDDTNVGLNLES